MTAIIIVVIICITILIAILLEVCIQKYENEWTCHHDWKIYSENKVRDDFGGISHEAIFICKKCGKIRKVKL